MKSAIINDFTRILRVCLAALLPLVVLAGCGGAGGKEDVPLYLENLSPDSMLRIMERRALLLGGCDAEMRLSVAAAERKAEMIVSLAFDAPARFRVQFSKKGEPPALDFVLDGRRASFYFPAELKLLETDLDTLLSQPNGLLSIAEAVAYMPGALRDFEPYGVQTSTGRFVYFRKAGRLECRAFVDRPTLTVRELLYSTDSEVFFRVAYSDFLAIGDGVWPRRTVIEAERFRAELKVVSIAATGMHSITTFALDVLPGTQTVHSPSEISGDETGWQD